MQRENETDAADWGWEAPLVPADAAEPSSEPSPERWETNRLAVVTLILGLLGIFFLAVPLGMIALAQIRNRGQRGGVLARAGMAASMCYVLAGVMVMAFFPIGGSDEKEDEALPPMLSRNLAVGDCVESVEESDVIDAIPVVPCDQPHVAEVIIQFPVEGSWPGRDESARRADARCSAELTPALINSPMLAELRSFIYFPANAMQWRNYPKVSCLVMRVDGRDLAMKIPR
ncbi:DUF4190 domain-containing protein [Nocardia sp. CC201C]|uniref:DUF4190 domain-containing protein n=1 Tax=Nocardia sp. CC201C TaxID=3044575 RepID=UPI0024A9180B|nr:DUF4190 domain-containing protein [Nocardia sp. CC201C]